MFHVGDVADCFDHATSWWTAQSITFVEPDILSFSALDPSGFVRTGASVAFGTAAVSHYDLEPVSACRRHFFFDHASSGSLGSAMAMHDGNRSRGSAMTMHWTSPFAGEFGSALAFATRPALSMSSSSGTALSYSTSTTASWWDVILVALEELLIPWALSFMAMITASLLRLLLYATQLKGGQCNFDPFVRAGRGLLGGAPFAFLFTAFLLAHTAHGMRAGAAGDVPFTAADAYARITRLDLEAQLSRRRVP